MSVVVPALGTDERYDVPGLPAWLTELHLHIGGGVAPHILFAIANEQGIKLPTRDYFEFVELVTSDPKKVQTLDDYLRLLEWTEKIQSSPMAIERSIYEILAKEYRGSRVRRMELRFNPMKRNLGGERDLDHIIHAALRGMDRACLAYHIDAGLIFCLAREFSLELNEILVEKAIKYRSRGVIGIDLAGTEQNNLELNDAIAERYAALFLRAKDAGLGTTVHTGETPHTNGEGVIAVIKHLKPDRIGHGIRAAYNEEAMNMLSGEGIVLEICPTSNLHTRAVKGISEMSFVLQRFLSTGVRFTINTDATYTLATDLRREVELLVRSGTLSGEDVTRCFEIAEEATFIKA